MGIDVTVLMGNLARLDDSAEEIIADGDSSSYCSSLETCGCPFLYINNFRLRSSGGLALFASKIGLSQRWSDPDQMDALFFDTSAFRQDSTVKIPVNDKQVQTIVEFQNLLDMAEEYQSVSEYIFTFIHPKLIEELSTLFEHENCIPIELLEKVFEKEYEEYVRPKKLRKPNSNPEENEQQSVMELREWLSTNDDYVFFNNILLFYNTPAHVFSLLEKPLIGKEKVTNILQPVGLKFGDIAEEYWISIMEFIEDPFTLTRLGMSHSKLYNILVKNRKEWYSYFKGNIGLFSYLT